VSCESSAILHGALDQDVLPAMYICNRLTSESIRPEFPILRLLCCVSMNFCYLRKQCVSVHRGDDCINDEVATVREEVERYHVSRSRAIDPPRTDPGLPGLWPLPGRQHPEARS
jgi:hypothetical protein